MRWIYTALICAYSASVLANPTQADLRQIEREIQREQQAGALSARKAAELSDEVHDVQQQMVKLARSVQAKEEDLTNLENRQIKMRERQKELEKKLSLTNAQLVRLMSGMQALALRPTELALLESKTPLDTLRSQMIMGYSIPVIDGTNKQVRSDLAELANIKASLQEQIVLIKSAQTQLSEQSAQMDRLLQQKSILQAQYQASQTESQKRVKALGAQAKDLKDLLDRLEREKQEALQAAQQRIANNRSAFKPLEPMTGSFSQAKGRLPIPMRGTISKLFGIETVSGSHTKGITITGRPSARVSAPFDGTILFAGPFKNYGELVIIDHGDNYVSLLAGMEHLSTSVGQDVLAGEPIGQVKSAKPELYVEIRKDGQVIDPLPWFMQQ